MASPRAPREAHAIGQLGHASSPLSGQQPSLIICTGPIHPCSAYLHPYHPRQRDPSGRSLLLPQALPYLGTLPDSVPTFSVNPAGHPGLELLAMAALSGRAPGSSRGSAAPVALLQPEQMLLASPGPYNPMAAVSARVVKKVLDLEFVEMAEISADDDLQATGRPGGPARPPIATISQWLERFSVMASVLATRFPEKAPELFAYQASIIRTERNYEGKQWVAYDRQFRREALARKDLNWSVPNLHLYNDAFTGRAKAIARCSVCLQDDHTCNRVPQKSCRASRLGRTNVAIPTHPGHLQEINLPVCARLSGVPGFTLSCYLFPSLSYWNGSRSSLYIIIGRAKRAPHWGVQSRFRVIYIYMCVCRMSNHVESRESNTRMLKVSIGR